MQSTATLSGGPADGVTLEVDRTPIMLRVASCSSLHRVLNSDQQPREGETVSAYVMCQMPSTGFWDGRDPKTGRRTGGMFSHAKYALCELQPGSTALHWAQWCDANKAALMAEHNKYVTKASS